MLFHQTSQTLSNVYCSPPTGITQTLSLAVFFSGSVCFVLLLVGNWMQFSLCLSCERGSLHSGVSRMLLISDSSQKSFNVISCFSAIHDSALNFIFYRSSALGGCWLELKVLKSPFQYSNLSSQRTSS